MDRSPESPLGYAEFGAWYDSYSVDVLEPSLDAAWSALDETLVDVLQDRDLARIRSTAGRVKSKRRTWRKLQQPRHVERIRSTADIPEVLHDLVGLRITCINVRDIDMVQAALEGLPRSRPKRGRLWLDPASERDYVLEPKDSGYRAWHVNLGIAVQVDGRSHPVTCELQVRTLLQDTWGELTHEDTYSKDGALPPLVEVLSKRMADLFSILDDIAEDLRTELDRIDEAAVAETDSAEPLPEETDALSGLAADAAAVLLERWRTLDRPTDLAALAWALQREFGAEISDDWFGHRSFKQFLHHAVPEGEVSTGRQAFLLPREDPPVGDGGGGDQVAFAIPDQARRLRRIDRGFPLLEAERWPILYAQLAAAWRRIGSRRPTTQFVNQLTRSARDRADAAGTSLSRRHLDHVAKGVLSVTESGDPLNAARIAEVFTALTLQRMTDLRILDDDHPEARAAVESWLAGDRP